ncbi:MAG TPA: helix-hairpin-helix domain-containing protein [Pyrinomonadaceae bacterium]|nr:helix-hairpin-helix domain-containing protein [Pyrinomonadaceae bacterium]
MTEETQIDITVPGGRYEVNGQVVDAFGNPVSKTSVQPKSTQSAFPEDYPGYEVLGQVEGMTPEKLAAMSDDEITAINGIGPATLKQIRAR